MKAFRLKDGRRVSAISEALDNQAAEQTAEAPAEKQDFGASRSDIEEKARPH